jgi:hypothetical protein
MSVYSGFILPIVIAAYSVFASAGQSVEGDEILTGDEAEKILFDYIKQHHVYDFVPEKCLYAEREEDIGYWLYTIRYDAQCTGDETTSNLLDRFAAIRHSHEIVWFFAGAPDQFRSMDEYWASRKHP